MKTSMKVALISLVVSLVVSVVTIKAATFTGVYSVKLPGFNKLTTLEEYKANKVKLLEQSYYNTGVVATNGGDYLPLKVRTKNTETSTYSSFLTLNKMETGTWKASSTNINYYEGKYVLQMKTGKSTVWGASHGGLWYYDQAPTP
ncbi:MAG: hypothetical protein MR779_00775 [Tenericutes bacterium]|nr:hypothetical protein [Mycoplasmatota bacterium]